ncbi:hypothetical protein CHITON_0287 [Thermococcus chitonophagus]|uniref:Uncharacterized protein n=1 Tax=Thermococcus chitonophagus TaxID=54262 RepID=A0A160VRR7_9EURY|nr:hypothetical protein CHITON_0287 [Thermococcus chitonophagus]
MKKTKTYSFKGRILKILRAREFIEGLSLRQNNNLEALKISLQRT